MAVLRFEDRMGDVDALMWAMEDDPVLRSTVVAVARLASRPDRDRFLARVERSVRELPRLRQVAVDAPLGLGTPRWRPAPEVDLDHHVRFVRTDDSTEAALWALVDEIAGVPFDRTRPLWQHTVVDLGDDAAAVVLKVHHSLTDGVGGMAIAAGLLFDLEADPEGEPPSVEEGTAPGGGGAIGWVDHEVRRQLGRGAAVVSGAGAVVRSPGTALPAAGRSLGSALRMVAPVTGPLSPVLVGRSGQRRHSAFDVDLDDLRRAAKAAEAKVNDAFLAAVAGGLGAVHRRLGAPVQALRVTMPISVRSGGADVVAGNRHAPSRFPLPVGEADPVARMRALARQVAAERDEPAIGFVEPFAGLVRHLPAPLRQGLFGGMLKGVDVLASNVAGVPVPLYLAGARLDALVPFGPPLGAAVNVTLLSYLDRASIGVVTDARAVADHDALVSDLRAGFDEIVALG